MTSLFISYSRKDIAFARKLTEAFEGQEWDFWIDWEGIPPTTDWWGQIEKGIEETGVFLFLISPDSVRSDVCIQEIGHAAKNGKRLIPIVVRNVSAGKVPSELGSLNWIFFRKGDPFETAFETLTTAIKTDYDWVETHRQLQVKALEWERSGHENSFLLRGKELQEAEIQLAANSSKEPHPTELQREYVLKSRQATDKQRTITITVAIVVGIALTSLAIFGWVQAGRATNNAQEAQTQEAIAQAQSTQAFMNAGTAQAASTLAFNNAGTAQANAEAAQQEARLARAREISTWVQTVAQPYTVDQPLLALTALQVLQPGDPGVPSAERTIREITGERILLFGHAEEIVIQPGYRSAISSDGRWFAKAYPDGVIDLWQVLDAAGSTIFTGSPDVQLDVQNSAPPGVYEAPLADSYRIRGGFALSSHGKWMAVNYNYLSILLWDLQNPDETPRLLESDPAMDFVGDMVFSPDENWLAVVDRTFESIFLFDLRKPGRTGMELERPCTGDFLCIFSLEMIFLESGDKFIVTGDFGEAHLWDLANLQAGYQAFAQDTITEACSSDQRCLLRVNSQAAIRSSEAVADILAVSPDARWLVARSSLNRYGLWDIHRPESEPIILPNISDAAFSSDSSRLILAEPDRSIHVWYLDEEMLLKAACKLAGRNFSLEEWTRYFGSEPYRANCPDFPSAPPQPTSTAGILFNLFPTLEPTSTLTP